MASEKDVKIPQKHVCQRKGFFFFIQKVFSHGLSYELWYRVCELLLTAGAMYHSSVKKSESKSAKKDKPGPLRGLPHTR